MITNLSIELPIRIVSEANNRDHWTKKRARRIAQQQEVFAELHNAIKGRKILLPCTVHLVRIGCNKLDSDNLANGFKGVRDAIAKVIGVDDGSELVQWCYKQEIIRQRRYAIRIEIDE